MTNSRSHLVSRRWRLTAAVAAAFAASLIMVPSAAAAGSPTGPAGSPSGSGTSATGGVSVQWGITSGKAWYQVLRGSSADVSVGAGLTKLNASNAADVAAATTATCTLTISDVTFNGHFSWETSQFCSGAYGLQQMHTRMERSSWSGYRAYSAWSYTPETSDAFLDYYWSYGCNSTSGTYNYRAVVYGWASGIGSSPLTISNNAPRETCGT